MAIEQTQVHKSLVDKADGLVGEILDASMFAPSVALELKMEAFITKYDVIVLGESQVSLALPHGTSRLDLLNEAQALVPDLLGQPAVYAPRLQQWANDENFTIKAGNDGVVIAVDGNVSNSTRMTRCEQENRGWNDVELCDLVAAHQAFLIATGKNLFNGNVVRSCGDGCALYFDSRGLGLHNPYRSRDAFRYDDVAASACMPSQSQ